MGSLSLCLEMSSVHGFAINKIPIVQEYMFIFVLWIYEIALRPNRITTNELLALPFEMVFEMGQIFATYKGIS